MRLTAQEAKPDAVGASENIERWVEFVQRRHGQGTRGRQHRPAGRSQEGRQGRAAAGRARSKVQMLKGNDYLRVWINKGGNHYLIHLPTGAAATP